MPMYRFSAIIAITYAIMSVIASCTRHNATSILIEAENLAELRPDSALSLLWEISNPLSNLNQDELMLYAFIKAKAHQRCGISLAEDSILPKAIAYYKMKGDSTKINESHLLLAGYYSWNNDFAKTLSILDEGLETAQKANDTLAMVKYLTAKSEIYSNHLNDYKAAIATKHEILRLLPENYSMVYSLAENMARNNEVADELFKKSIRMALNADDKDRACHFLRNYASVLSSQGRYEEALQQLQEMRRLLPDYDNFSVTQINLSEIFLNLGRMDSARHYLAIGWENENRLREQGDNELSRYVALAIMQSISDHEEGKNFSLAGIGQFCDSFMKHLRNLQNTALQQMETKSHLQQENYELALSRQRLWIILLGTTIFVLIAATALFARIRQKRYKLAEAEEHIDVLKQMLKDAESKQDNDELFKRLLLQQLGIIKMVASSPSEQNQEVLRRIASISHNEITTKNLIVWSDLYPVIDKLHGNFHTDLIARYGKTLNEKEVQICCLLCAGFSTKEIGVITQQSSATIYVRKTSIRHKLGISEKEDILAFLTSIFTHTSND